MYNYIKFMEISFVYGLAAIIITSLVSFIGGLLFVISKEKLKKVLPYLVSLSAGALIGDALIHLLPEAFEGATEGVAGGIFGSLAGGYVGIFVLVGFFMFLALEYGLHWHHSHDNDEESHSHGNHISVLITIADGVHNFIDGIIIAIGFSIGVEVGIATTIAVILHEIPQEIGDIGLLIYGGWSKKKALFFNFLSACTAIVGFLLVWALRNYSNIFEQYLPYFLATAAGGFIYIACADLIPELKRNHSDNFIKHILVILGGIIAMALLLLLE